MLIVSVDTSARQQHFTVKAAIFQGKLEKKKKKKKSHNFSAAVLDMFLTFFHDQYKNIYLSFAVTVALMAIILRCN